MMHCKYLLTFTAIVLAVPAAGCGATKPEPAAPLDTFESRIPASDAPVAPAQQPARGEDSGGWLTGSDLCTELIGHGPVRVEPIYGGAVVEIFPTSLREHDKVRQAVWEFERRVEHLPGERPDLRPGALSTRCGMTGLRSLGATMLVTETGQSIKLMITADDADRGPEVVELARALSGGATGAAAR